MSERPSDWSSTYASILVCSRPQCSVTWRTICQSSYSFKSAKLDLAGRERAETARSRGFGQRDREKAAAHEAIKSQRRWSRRRRRRRISNRRGAGHRHRSHRKDAQGEENLNQNQLRRPQVREKERKGGGGHMENGLLPFLFTDDNDVKDEVKSTAPGGCR